jgi:hypothetical protein
LGVASKEVILEGDLIASPVYDPDRSPSFAVLGDFDLNHDGIRDSGGRSTIVSLIAEWGGTVVDEVTAMTDFVVVGAAPAAPKRVSNPSAEQTAAALTQQQVLDAYSNQLATTNLLAVPAMTQDVFLNFLGFGVESAGRR